MSAPRQSRRPLWLVAQDFISILFNLFGAPEEIAERHTLLREQWALMTKWLRAGEALMRQLLLVEAASMPKPNTRPILWPRRARKRRLMSFSAEAPQAWRVSFRCFVGDARARPARGRASVSSTRFHAAWPLAERAEALLRVFNDPAPYARRLARRLYATPHRARGVMRCEKGAPALVGAVAFGTVRAAVRMFKNLWELRRAGSAERRQALKAQRSATEQHMTRLLDRVVETTAPAVIEAYEARIADLNSRKLVLSEKIANAGAPIRSFEDSLRTALEFLSNPWKLWASEQIAHRRAVLKLAFADNFKYVRNQGFRTAELASPFKLLAEFSALREGMVGATGIEPVTPTMST